jgi:hypothetical protein
MTTDEIECIEGAVPDLAITLLRGPAAGLDADVRISADGNLGSVEFEAHAA